MEMQGIPSTRADELQKMKNPQSWQPLPAPPVPVPGPAPPTRRQARGTGHAVAQGQAAPGEPQGSKSFFSSFLHLLPLLLSAPCSAFFSLLSQD